MQNTLLPIHAVARKLGLPEQYFEQVGPYGGKVKVELLADPSLPRRGKLILVTATTPTASGEGKTVTVIGLAQGLAQLGKRAVVTLRQPSLGPVFGMKSSPARIPAPQRMRRLVHLFLKTGTAPVPRRLMILYGTAHLVAGPLQG